MAMNSQRKSKNHPRVLPNDLIIPFKAQGLEPEPLKAPVLDLSVAYLWTKAESSVKLWI